MFDKIKESVQKFSRKGVADEEAVEELVKDIQRDLIRADVDVGLVSDITDEIREEALEEELPSGLTRKEHVLEIVYNKLEDLMGEAAEVEIESQTILLCGLYGAGKTTTAGKLADFYRKRGMKVGVIAADTDRPAAYDQLQQIAEDVEAEFYGEKDAEDPVKVVRNGMEELEDVDVKIVDSAGRNSLNEELQQELADIDSTINPDEKYLVIPADIGQSARDQTESFNEAVGLTGVIVTKMDSSAKGGGALVACEHSGASVKFIGTGEEMGDLEVYDPVEFVSQMIGQPDLESLLEKIEEMDTDPEAILEGEFTLHDFRDQMESVTDSGMMEEMLQQLPIGGSQIPDNVTNMTEEKIGNYTVIMDSMTEEEMKDPSVINKSRTERIAEGSGTSRNDVRELVKHYRQTKNMVDKFDKKSMKRGNMQDMLQNLGI
jgi:signal recognition particle subunit SRP54